MLRLLEEGEFDRVLDDFVTAVLSPRHAAGGPARDLLNAMARDLGPAAYAQSAAAIASRGSFEDVLALVRVPMLFLTGEHDALTPPEVARRAAAQVPSAHAREISGAGHMTPLEAPEQVASLLGSFFEEAFSQGHVAPPWGPGTLPLDESRPQSAFSPL